jgi:hypothetical protein
MDKPNKAAVQMTALGELSSDFLVSEILFISSFVEPKDILVY